MTRMGISRAIKTLGITGMREHFSRGGRIEEPVLGYWGPSAFCLESLLSSYATARSLVLLVEYPIPDMSRR